MMTEGLKNCRPEDLRSSICPQPSAFPQLINVLPLTFVQAALSLQSHNPSARQCSLLPFLRFEPRSNLRSPSTPLPYSTSAPQHLNTSATQHLVPTAS
mmetsp:Transcript_37558/g.58657  ORF Transcript_37558/g.58657 Transcript_37558/m.58657 type:complete len:98 (-) Transcript_37558:192-485(-)